MLIGRIPRNTAKRLTWAAASYGAIQFIKMVNNVVLARLLAPSLFGLMLIVNSVRTGVELLSDVGINQNIVSNEKGHTREFSDTAWTLRAIRGVVLGTICFISARTLAHFFGKPELATIFPVVALIFVFTGFESVSKALLQKQKRVGRVSVLDIVTTALTMLVHVALAIITPTIWALVLGSIISGAIGLIVSYLIVPGVRHRIEVDRKSASEILHFGKWIFASSIIYFFAMNFDRLYFAKQIALSELGVYAIARSLSDMVNNLVVRASNMVLFPTVAGMSLEAPELRMRLLHGRRTILLGTALALAAFVAFADVVVKLLYDARYANAAIFLPLLLVGVWISILSTVNDSILLGTRRPAYPAIANAAKFATYLVGVPIAFQFSGLLAAIVVLVVGEAVRYMVLWLLARRRQLAFARDDLALTALFLLLIVVVRKLTWAAGLTSDLDSLFPLLDRIAL